MNREIELEKRQKDGFDDENDIDIREDFLAQSRQDTLKATIREELAKSPLIREIVIPKKFRKRKEKKVNKNNNSDNYSDSNETKSESNEKETKNTTNETEIDTESDNKNDINNNKDEISNENENENETQRKTVGFDNIETEETEKKETERKHVKNSSSMGKVNEFLNHVDKEIGIENFARFVVSQGDVNAVYQEYRRVTFVFYIFYFIFFFCQVSFFSKSLFVLCDQSRFRFHFHFHFIFFCLFETLANCGCKSNINTIARY